MDQNSHIDCSEITFVMPSRNDGYSCQDKDSIHEIISKIEISIYSALQTFPKSRFILVDFCTEPQRVRLVNLIQPREELHVVTVSHSLLPRLMADNNNSAMNFYEFLAKHIGFLAVTTPYVIFINQDAVLPTRNQDSLLADLYANKIVLAWKDKIQYHHVNLETKALYELCESRPPAIHEHGAWGNGDFLGISTQIYKDIGGYLLCHHQWSIDNEILHRIGIRHIPSLTPTSRIPVTRPYTIYALDHPEDGFGRSREEHNFRMISSDIIADLQSYIS